MCVSVEISIINKKAKKLIFLSIVHTFLFCTAYPKCLICTLYRELEVSMTNRVDP